MDTREDFKSYFQLIYKRKFVLFLSIFLFCVMSILYTMNQKKIYESHALLLIDKETAKVLNEKEVLTLGDTNYWSYQEYLKTQMEVLRSRSLAESVLKSLPSETFRVEKTNPEEENKLKFTKQLKELIPQLKKHFFNFSNTLTKTTTGPDPLLENMEQQWIIDQFQFALSVDHLRGTRIVKVAYRSTSPSKSALVVNKICDIFIQQNLQRKIDASIQARKWLLREINLLKTSLKRKEESLQSFRQDNDLISPDERKDILNLNLSYLNEKLTEAQGKYAEYKKRYRNKHPRMKQTVELIETLKKLIKDKRFEAIQFEEKLIRYNELIREVNLTQKLLQLVIKREKETLISSSIPTNNISILEKGNPQRKPVSPRPLMNIFFGVILGAVFGSTLAILLEILQWRIHKSSDFISHEIPFLGSIPKIKRSILKTKAHRDLYLFFNSKGIISEIFNNLRTSILLESKKPEVAKGKSILFTSFLPNEGKTLISSNLAVALAKFNFRTLLLEADLRKPRLKKVFQIEVNGGLSNLLKNPSLLPEDYIQPTAIPNLDYLSSGPYPEHPSELLGSQRFSQLIHDLEKAYDVIIIDSPPLFAVTDPVILASLVKKVILIGRYNYTPKHLLPLAKEKLGLAQAKIIGAILNRVPKSSQDISSYQDYFEQV